VPARLALLAGFVMSVVGILYAFTTAILIMTSTVQIPIGIPTIIVGIFFLGGIQLLFLGLIGEYILSIHGQVKPKPKVFDISY
jgi:ABC-type sulfate transport system permease component